MGNTHIRFQPLDNRVTELFDSTQIDKLDNYIREDTK